jgi:predicted amidohydrolase
VERIRAAAVQMSSGKDYDANLERATALVRRAAGEGAGFVALPENFALMTSDSALVERVEPVDGPLVGWGRELARSLGIDLLLGSIPEQSARAGKRRNTSVLVDREGKLVAAYRKVHLFDIDLDELRLRESEAVEPGAEAVWADLPWCRIGLSVCYDLRFPELYRQLAAARSELLTVPSAFTAKTGPDHWHLLLRARAVENQAFVVAPAQVGRHSPRRASYGHALIVDPWGEVLADAGGEGEALAVADLDPERLEKTRRFLPALEHVRLRVVPRDDAEPPGSGRGD